MAPPSVISRVKALPPELRHLIAKHHVGAFGRGIAAELAWAQNFLNSKKVLSNNLSHVIAVKRHSRTPAVVVLGVYHPRHIGRAQIRQIHATDQRHRGYWGVPFNFVPSKRPIRCSVALYSVQPVNGPWRKRGDVKTPKALLQPVRTATRVCAGQTTNEARAQMQRIVNSFVARVPPV